MLKNKIKDWSETMKVIATIITSTTIIGGFVIGGAIKLDKTLTETTTKINKAVEAVNQVERNTEAIKEIKATYTPLVLHNEMEKYAITQIDLEIDETMARVANNEYVGTRYVSTLKFYYDNFNFLSSKQRSMIEIIMKYYDKQEMRNNNSGIIK